jgi:stage II sporulation protein D
MQESASKDFDVTSDIYSQVYGGGVSERSRTNRAVEETRGRILTYQGKIFPAYFHATCAGHTEDASLLWDIDIAPLKGTACGFCAGSPHFDWHMVLSLEEIKDVLAKTGRLKQSGISDAAIMSRDGSGRVATLRFVTDKGDNIDISGKDFRNMIGPNIIRSTNFKLEVVERDAIFTGSGWGHGVGLCQWGAYFMAKQGWPVERILRHYYPGSELSGINN